MTPEEEQLVKLRLGKAHDTLTQAELLLNAGFVIGAVNRIYYACFYAVNALLYTEGMSSSKHGGVLALFDRHWMKPRRLPVEMGKLYREFFEVRQEGDYRDTAHFDPDEVRKWLSQAQSFVQTIADWLHDNAGIEPGDIHAD